MRFVQRPDSFQLDQDGVLDQQVHEVFAYSDPVIFDGDAPLLLNLQLRLAQFVCQCIFLDPFKESAAEGAGYRQGASDHFF